MSNILKQKGIDISNGLDKKEISILEKLDISKIENIENIENLLNELDNLEKAYKKQLESKGTPTSKIDNNRVVKLIKNIRNKIYNEYSKNLNPKEFQAKFEKIKD